MRTILLVIIALAMIGIAGAVDLSGTDISVFDQPKMAKDGVDGSSPMLTSSQEAFLKDGEEMNATIPGKPVLLLGRSVGYDRTAWYNGRAFFTPAELQNASPEMV